MSNEIKYPVTLTPDEDGGFVVDFPDLGGFSQGDTQEEALLNAEDLLETIIASMIKDNEDIPHPSKIKGAQMVPVPPMTAAKLFLYWEMKKQGVNKAQLARKLHWHAPQVDRLLDVRHESKISAIETAAAAMGKRIAVSFSDLRAHG